MRRFLSLLKIAKCNNNSALCTKNNLFTSFPQIKKFQDILLYKQVKFLIHAISPSLLMKYRHLILKGRWPNIKAPKTFDEKLIWLNFFWQHPLKTICGDKYAMRNYVKKNGLGHILVPILGVYNNPNEIDFDRLPEKFVLKCTHGCGFNIISSSKNSLNIESTKKRLSRWMRQNIGKKSGELHYATMKPRIISEVFLEEPNSSQFPIDYKVYCFGGKAHCTMVCLGRDLSFSAKHFIFFNRDWTKRLNYDRRGLSENLSINKPTGYEKMIEYAEQLSKPFPFVRLDFYIINGKPLLGEMTFTPNGCVDPTLTELAQIEMGSLITLPDRYIP